MVEMYKLMTGKTKSDYQLFFQLAPQRSGAVNTRGNAGYLNVQEPPLAKTDTRRFFFFQSCPRFCNALSDVVKQAGTVASFKAAYNEHMAA